MRERFIACCAGSREDVALLGTWSSTLKSLRWEAIENFTTDLLRVEALLRQAWNLEKFMAGNGQRHKRFSATTTDYGPNLDAINKTIQDERFWSGVAFVHDLAYEAEYIGKWAESCSCCSSAVERRANTCPYRGCRAPELASGEWRRKLQHLLMRSRARMSAYLVQSPNSRQADFEGWAAARSKLWSGLHIKLAYWRQLPWRLCALSHTNPATVCSAAKDCLELWDAGGPGTLHAQSCQFLSPGWCGLKGSAAAPDASDVPLRSFVARLAAGETVLGIYDADPNTAEPFVRWLAALRLVSWAMPRIESKKQDLNPKPAA